MTKLPYVFVLRGIAILMVIAFHCVSQGTGYYKMHPYLVPVVNEGARGVQLFFIISAFTLYRSHYLRNEEEQNATRNFFIRRFLRVAPMYYLATLYYLISYSFFKDLSTGHEPVITVSNVLTSVFFVNSFSPYWIAGPVLGGWTVGVEMVFYALLPFLFNTVKDSRQALNFFIIALVLRIVIVNLLKAYPLIHDITLWNTFLFFSVPNQMFVFALGILAFFIIDDNYSVNVSPKSLIFLSVFLAIGFIFNNEFFIPNFFLMSICFFMFIIALSKYQPEILINNFFIHVGKISFSLYLIHFPVFYWMKVFHIIDFVTVHNSFTALANYLIRLLVTLIICFGITSLCYRFIERPFIKLGERMIGE